MGGVAGMRFIPLNTAGGAPDQLTRLLLTGAVLRGRIAADGALLNLIVAGQKFQLPKGVSLSPGTNVEAQITHEGGAPQLRLQVIDSSTQAASTRPITPAQPQLSAPAVPVPPSLAALIKPEQAATRLAEAVEGAR